jgi:hypothetical protein
MSPAQLNFELQAGARFVVFQWVVSVVIVSFKESSEIHFIRPGENAFAKGVMFSIGSLLLGWWGIPWGPIWTISTIVSNCRGGKDVTAAVVRAFNSSAGAAPGGAT